MKIKNVPVRNTLAALLFSTSIGMVACNNDASETSTSDTTTTTETMNAGSEAAMANLSGTTADTTVSGMVHFERQPDGQVKMTLDITVDKKANSSVAVHIHENADCGDHGNHAGGHWNPTNENHGKWGEGSFHSGDLGNIQLDASGKGTMEATSNRWSIGGDAKTNVMNKTIVVHSGVDDYTSQPSGNSGNRIGCGVIQ